MFLKSNLCIENHAVFFKIIIWFIRFFFWFAWTAAGNTILRFKRGSRCRLESRPLGPWRGIFRRASAGLVVASRSARIL